MAWHVENGSGATLARPELFRLLRDREPGHMPLVEQVGRLTSADWTTLPAEIDTRQVRSVALDLQTSWTLAVPSDDLTARMYTALNGMMLDVLAAWPARTTGIGFEPRYDPAGRSAAIDGEVVASPGRPIGPSVRSANDQVG